MAGDFGTRFMPEMSLSTFSGETDGWDTPRRVPSDSLTVHPGAHVLHYASTCFEGLKAFRLDNGSVSVFRMDQNIARYAQSSALLYLPAIDPAHTRSMIVDILGRFHADVPAPPASMYIRPTHFGTEPAIGKAAEPSATSLQYVLLSPVGDYFAGGEANLRLLIETDGARCDAHHGRVKGGGNYASALKYIMQAREAHGAHQVLFCPDGNAQETGAANFMLIDGDEVITKPLDDSFLHGVTRDSLLVLAREQGLTVKEQELPVEELVERASKPGSEAGLTGTAAVLAAVGTLIHGGREIQVGSGEPGPRIRAMRDELNNIQWGRAEDRHGWLTTIEAT